MKKKKKLDPVIRMGRIANIVVVALLTASLVATMLAMNLIIAAASEYPGTHYVQTTGGDNRG